MPPARAEAGPVASLPVARKRGCLPFQRPGCRARLLGRPGALQRLPLRLRLVTAYPQGCCDPWGPRSCAACAEQPPLGLAGRSRLLGAVAGHGTPHPGRGSASSGNGTRVLAHQGHIPSAWAAPVGCRSRRAAPSGGGAPAPCPVPLPRRSWHGLAAALPWTPGDLGRALVVPPLRVLGERLLSLGRQRTRVLLGGIGALVLTRSCGPCGSPGRLAVAWCAWSSGGHRVLLVA